MSTTDTRTLRVYRFKRGDGAGHFDEFEVPVAPRTTVLEALRWIQLHRDPSLALRHSCLHASCGTCGVQVDGREELACVCAVRDHGETITVVKDMGLVTKVLDERHLAPLEGHLSIGHVRYSTTGSSTWRNAQPVYRSVGDAGFSLGHNGNLTNTEALAAELGMLPGVLSSDSELVGELLGREYGDELRSDGRAGNGRVDDERELDSSGYACSVAGAGVCRRGADEPAVGQCRSARCSPGDGRESG